MYALLTLPNATTTIALAGQDVPTWFAEISPALVLVGIPIAVISLGILVYAIRNGFEGLFSLFSRRADDGYTNNMTGKKY